MTVKFNDNYKGANEDEIGQKVATDVISYKIREKAFISLMSKGIIYPIGITDGWER